MLIRNISSLSAVFHKAPETFVSGARITVDSFDGDVPDAEELPAGFGEEEVEAPTEKKKKKKKAEEEDDGLGDLLTASGMTPTHGQTQAKNEVDDLMGLLGGSGMDTTPPAPTPGPTG